MIIGNINLLIEIATIYFIIVAAFVVVTCSRWLHCTQSLNPNSLSLHFEINCPPIFVVS